MTITDNSRTTAPRPVSSLTRALSQVSLEEQARPAKKAALSIASETLKAQQTRQIVSYCNAIDREIPLIQVNTRRALSTYLVNNRIHDTGLLNQRQKNLCAWTLLEHAARGDSDFKKIYPAMVGSYVGAAEKPRFEALARSMNLNPANFIA